jgi:1-acyl-sn-glycerol-3-phosphate acyltransferase
VLPQPVLLHNSPWLIRLFSRYCRSYLRKNFHAVRLAWAGRPVDPGDVPLIIVVNHPSWWDPLVGLVLSGLFPGRQHFAPIDAAALGRYRIFERLGFFPVEQSTAQGAREFLQTSVALLAGPGRALWITAQGSFTDPRLRPVQLKPGIAHVVRRLEKGVILPLALEYPFWEERYPEALARFGEPIAIDRGSSRSVDQWVAMIAAGLTRSQDALAVDAQRRAPDAFEVLLDGKAGVGGVYDLWRRFKALAAGKRFQVEHGKRQPTTALGNVS